MRKTKFSGLTKALMALGILVIMAACQDLHVENPNNPDRDRALDEPDDVIVLVQSSWVSWYWRHNRSCWPGYALWGMSGEQTTTVGNCGAWPYGVAQPGLRYNNSTSSNEVSVAQSHWYNLYTDISSANDGLRAIDRGMVFGEGGEDTPMVQAFAQFTWGLNMGLLAKHFDQAFIVRHDDDLEDSATYETHPWQDVRDVAIQSLVRAAEIADANSFTIPNNWINGIAMSDGLLSQVAHTYAALLHVYTARTPDDRAAVDWNQVLFHLDRGITEPFSILAGSGEGDYSLYRFRIAATGTFSWRTNLWLLGPGDTSGKWQEWVATPVTDRRQFVIESADRRIHPEGDPMQEGEDVDFSVQYFQFRDFDVFNDARGLHNFSNYAFMRNSQDWVTTGNYTNTDIDVFHPDELALIRAEAYLHLGQGQAAADIINGFRARGELPPVTPAGVPQSADCVPRTTTGACGDLYDALKWERGIELVGLRGIRAYYDRRGLGQLVCGVPMHFPIPARELESQLMPLYSFGGEGREGSLAEPHCVSVVGSS